MGTSGQLVRPWFDAGSVAGGEQLVARPVLRLFGASFLDRCALIIASFFRHF